MPTAESPAPSLVGFEVGDDISRNRSTLQQITKALQENGIAVPLPGNFQSPGLAGQGVVGAGGAQTSGDPIDQERKWMNNILAVIDALLASLILTNGSSTNLLEIVALKPGSGGNSITVAVAAGTSSGKKITITNGVTTEVYDNLASVAAAVAAIHGVSALVDAVEIAEGTLGNISATALAGGVTVTPPTFMAGQDDGQSVRIQLYCAAIITALQASGYMQ